MGCGESKHAVSTENTLVPKTNSKRSNSTRNTTSENNSPVSKDSVNGNTKPNEISMEETEAKNENQGNGEPNVKIEENEEKIEAVEVVKGKKEEIENGDVKEDKKEEEEGKKVLDSHDVEETGLINGSDAKPFAEKEDGLKVGEVNEAVPVEETKVSASETTGEEKIADEKEKVTAASPDDVKAN